jgi:ADP-ribose pyrophosphatase YjhB (NUDIX family)
MISVHKKVFAYVTYRDQLLVFSHPDFPEAGLQVPAGTLNPGERPEEGVMREAYEETGLQNLVLVRFLGETRREMRDFGLEQVHQRFYFHLACSEEPPQTWRHYETHPSDGSPAPIAFDFFWVPFPGGVPPLIADMDEKFKELSDGFKS